MISSSLVTCCSVQHHIAHRLYSILIKHQIALGTESCDVAWYQPIRLSETSLCSCASYTIFYQKSTAIWLFVQNCSKTRSHIKHCVVWFCYYENKYVIKQLIWHFVKVYMRFIDHRKPISTSESRTLGHYWLSSLHETL